MDLSHLIARLHARFVAWDQRVARDTLDKFETRKAAVPVVVDVRVGTVEQVVEAVRPHGRPVIEHHWATWCEPCVEEIGRISALATALRGRVDVVGVSWDVFESHALDAAVEDVRRFAVARRLSFPTWVVDGEPDALFVALATCGTTVPQTRVRDGRGRVIAEFPGPLDDDEVAALRARLGG